MLVTENSRGFSSADALAIDTLFKRLAERGHKIRMRRQATDIGSSDRVASVGEQKDAIVILVSDIQNPDVKRAGTK